jgi:hypothetical protein
MKVSRWNLLWVLTVGVLVTVEIAIVTGVLTISNLLGFFILFVFALIGISVLAIVGAIFVGMWVSHRILSDQGFTPFEQEMLRMRQELKDLAARVHAIGEKLGAANPAKPKEP